MKHKILELSMDAMVGEDLEYLANKPNFSRIFKDSARVGSVTTIFPSITYPAHASMMTGCRPGKTGIYTNFRLNVNPPKAYKDWHLEASAIQAEDFFAAAKRAGRTTAAVYWPITGNNPNIDWEINELFFYQNEDRETLFRKYGANDEAIAVVKENLHRWPDTSGAAKSDPFASYFDSFITGCMCSLIRRDQPDFLIAHNCILDSTRHRHGVFHEMVNKALDQTDEWLGEIADAMEDAGVFEDTDFLLVSDHGQRDKVRNVRLNVLLRRAGFLEANEDGDITEWRARAIANGMSVYVALKDRNDEKTKREVFDYLQALANDGVWGFNKVTSAEEIREKYGCYGVFDFALNTDGYTSFIEGTQEPLVTNHDFTDYRSGKATHGYMPEDGAQPVFVARGPSFRPGTFVEKAQIIDEAPTIAHIMGQSLPQAEGRVLTELLRG